MAAIITCCMNFLHSLPYRAEFVAMMFMIHVRQDDVDHVAFVSANQSPAFSFIEINNFIIFHDDFVRAISYIGISLMPSKFSQPS